MITNEKKKEFLNKILEKVLSGIANDDIQKEIIEMLMSDTVNGKVYKYRTFNKYSLLNLKQGTLHCAKPSSFNDPFECICGMDISSYVSQVYGTEFDEGKLYFAKFGQILMSEIQIDDCTYTEKNIFNKWIKNDRFCKFILQIISGELNAEALIDLLFDNVDLLQEMMADISQNVEVKNGLTDEGHIFLEIMRNMEKNGLNNMIDPNSTFSDFAQGAGITDDADEITLNSRMFEKYYPDKSEDATKVDKLFDEANRELKKKVDNLYRVGSLCTGYKSTLMWSHYADCHRGFCVEYNFNNLADDYKNILILPVIYEHKRPMIPWEVALATNINTEEMRRKNAYSNLLSLLTKDKNWAYENEWRIIQLASSGKEDIKMPPVSCIYIGAQCEEKHRKKLIKIAKKINIPVKQMKLDRGEYKLHAGGCLI